MTKRAERWINDPWLDNRHINHSMPDNSKDGHPPMAVVPVPQSVTMVTARVLSAQHCARCATSLIEPRHAKGDAAPSSMIHT